MGISKVKDFAEADDILSSSDSLLLKVSILKEDVCFQRPAIIPLALINTSAHALIKKLNAKIQNQLNIALVQQWIGSSSETKMNHTWSARPKGMSPCWTYEWCDYGSSRCIFMVSYVEPKMNLTTQIAKCISSAHLRLIVWTSSYSPHLWNL